MLQKEIRYSYNDVMIQPANVSKVEHRSDCNPFIGKDYSGTYDMLPIFTAPMSTVVDTNNYELFYKNHIFAILPRNIDWEIRKEWIYNGKWVAVSLKEFEEFICDENNFVQCVNDYHLRVVIDVANGNMDKIFALSIIAKNIHTSHIEIMTGNIANPNTYEKYCECGIDYCRLSVGTGCGCITSSNTGIGDGIASLLNDVSKIRDIRERNGLFCTKVIADGGIRGYSDVIKAIGPLGADYVMIGGLLAQTVESAAPIYEYCTNGWKHYIGHHVRPCNDEENGYWKDTTNHYFGKLYKEFYGMASKYGQIAINGSKTKTSEGIKKEMEVTTNLDTWAKNMCDYLRSAMSYCGITDIKNFNYKNVIGNIISENVKNSINK